MKSVKPVLFAISLAAFCTSAFAHANTQIPREIKCDPNRPSSKQCTAKNGHELASLTIDSDVVEQGTYILASASAGLYTYANAQNPSEIVQLSA